MILECAEAIAFYLRAVTAAHVSEEKQIESLKLVVAYASLIIVIIGITIIRCQILVGTYWLGPEKIALCGRCQRRNVKGKYERESTNPNVIGSMGLARDCFHLQS